MSDHQTIPDSNMSDRHNNLPPTSKTENITAMSDRVSPTAQQAAVPTENPPSPQHANGHGHHHEHHHHTAQYGGNINPHETAEHVMAIFDRQMMALSDENTLASHTQACEIAEMPLERAELPLAFRVHAHVVLGCGKNGYLHHANEAVRFAEMGQRIYGPGKTAEAQAAVEDLMWQARETLRRAERDMEELEGIKESVKAGHLKLKSGQKLVYGNLNDDHDKAIPKPSTFQPANPSASEISKKSSDKASSTEADAQVVSTSDKPGEEISGEEEEDKEPEKEQDMESGEGEGEGEGDDQFGVQRLPEDLIRTALGGQKSGSGMVNPESTHHATPRRSTRSKGFNKDYFTGKPRKP
ncbi:hypothetical protein D6C78_03049 [Aureobasidium pullulans]|uniref:Uncharacterized protein n=1 Tax=Aureobasidium pullulans TaxID=5580 RepID=A0A4T0C5G5_AURPU|nr:hypothetical protein D6C78_03049 [Aureobasidium pullulans]